MSDYSFMRSGRGNGIENYSEAAIQEDLTVLLVAFSENSLKNAAIYCTHAGRNGVTTTDLKAAMMLECLVFLQRSDVMDQALSIKEELRSMDDDDQTHLDDPPEDIQPFTPSLCKCTLCNCINGIETRWSHWTPSNTLELVLKQNIDRLPCSEI